MSASRSQNICIMLAKFNKTPVADIASFVRNLDIDRLGMSALLAIERFLPTKQEAAELGAYLEAAPEVKKTKGGARAAEEFLWEMSKVPLAAERIRIMCLCLSLDETLLQLEVAYDAMFRGVAEVKGSSRLMYILRTTVDLINALKKAGTRLSHVCIAALTSPLQMATRAW